MKEENLEISINSKDNKEGEGSMEKDENPNLEEQNIKNGDFDLEHKDKEDKDKLQGELEGKQDFTKEKNIFGSGEDSLHCCLGRDPFLEPFPFRSSQDAETDFSSLFSAILKIKLLNEVEVPAKT